MKVLKLSILILLFGTAAAHAQFTKAELKINGLNCGLCAKTTQSSLKKMSFVEDVKTDPMRNAYLITFKNGAHVNFDEISKVIHDANFFVSSLKATFDFASVKVNNKQFTFSGDTFRLMNADKSPNGLVDLMIVDKGFAPKVVTKKYLGKADVGDTAGNGRLYHVAI
ncbi:MAG: heavy-metal-associated domain-containing protein [Mucilaginibacter sp.]